ncbi:hypothetical protein RO3G_00609 [Rhizopus delemar RA 99-880]|uniref:Uncharacterized protein n=1 Tax=Rhizopus delemar (strain RA 99-880 / ATCC MYA-4621 / FGSC 9543 / NRRL 43880) TaxID=246409 RepID=I1BI75_RHIO9|nr:hypothetical protein RO3G_00609 [Rhizopus delemar RA 99-880]|eukprot:EIE75905.1 hypothetical protein RO3G_00609 [Rhizopus delemar RA 99-880]
MTAPLNESINSPILKNIGDFQDITEYFIE